jgi:hypothetical protein
MRYSNLNTIALILFVIALSSCEKVIDIKLNPNDSKLVVEAEITNEIGSCKVKLSRVINYDQSNTYPEVSGAIVTLTDNGTVHSLTESTPGTYTLAELIGIPGHTYNLKISVDGEEFTSTCRMPEHVELDTLYADYEVFFIDTNLTAYIDYQDPALQQNYYRFRTSIADTVSKQFYLDDDTFYDGQYAEQSIVFFDNEYKTGDSLIVELWVIDKAVHKYFSTLSSIIDGQSGQVAAPANPESNITGGALGYFNAYSISRRSIIIP